MNQGKANSLNSKQVGLLNVDGYYDGLLSLFDKGVAEGFIKPTARNIALSAKTAPELISRMEVILHIYISNYDGIEKLNRKSED